MTVSLPQTIYCKYLGKIENVYFTRRESEIIAYLLHGRTEKEIASFLSIREKSVSTHTSNIRNKIGGIAKSSVLDFIEKSNKSSLIKNEYYQAIQARNFFEVELKKVFQSKSNESTNFLIVNYHKQENSCSIDHQLKDLIKNQLKKHLEMTGIKVVEIKNTQLQNLNSLKKHLGSIKHCILLVSSTEQGFINDFLMLFQQNENIYSSLNISCLVLTEDELLPTMEGLNNLENIHIFNIKKYYQAAFWILKNSFLTVDIESFNSDFLKKWESDTSPLSIQNLMESGLHKVALPYVSLNFFERNKKEILFFTLGISIFAAFCFLSFFQSQEKTNPSLTQHNLPLKEEKFIYIWSDLITPVETNLLNRLDLIAQIERKLTGKEEIQTVALTGIGGSGKTTLARQYARIQNYPVIWEVNAETRESLNNSFENLAYALAQSEDEKKILKDLQEIKNPKEKERKIMDFVKRRLKSFSSWFLIYDNMENFSDIQDHFPLDFRVWGKGKVILTTRNSNIRNNSYLRSSLQVTELHPEEKLKLFTMIMASVGKNVQKQEAKRFLNNIPPFPLDVLIAASYLKSFPITYEKYLAYLKKQDAHFISMQKEVLKETNSYTKTRYGIINLTLMKLIKKNKDFRDLLLFVSLLDSQNIPLDLLISLKDEVTVNNFIHHLKKHSLITIRNSSAFPSISLLSIHRSTQEISLNSLVKTYCLKQDDSLLESIVTAFEDYIIEIIHEDSLFKMKLLLSHGNALLQHAGTFSIRNDIKIRGSLGFVHSLLGDEVKAKEIINKSFEILNNFSDKDYSLLARLLMYLGNINRLERSFLDAIQNLEKSLFLYRKYSPKASKNIEWILTNLGLVYGLTYNFIKAEDLLKQSIEIRKDLYTADDRQLCWPKAILGLVYQHSGNYEKALILFKDCLKHYEKTVDKDYHNYGFALLYLGLIYNNLGFHEKARKLLERSYINYKKNYSTNSCIFTWSAIILGNFYREIGEYKKAKDLIEQNFKIYKKNYPKDHVCIAWASIHLGNIYRDLGIYDKAESLLQSSLMIYQKEYGKDHLRSAEILRDLGQLYLLRGDLEKSKNILLKALAIFHQYKHPEIYKILETLSEVYLQKSIYAIKIKDKQQSKILKNQSLDYLKQALEILVNHFPKDSPHISRLQYKLDKLIE